MAERIIATVPKNAREEIRVMATEYRGHDLIDMRVFVAVDGKPDMAPTRKGLTVRRDILSALIDALTRAQAPAGATA